MHLYKRHVVSLRLRQITQIRGFDFILISCITPGKERAYTHTKTGYVIVSEEEKDMPKHWTSHKKK